jgi:hypothetical protein
VLLVLWHALPRSEYSVESGSGSPAALIGWLGGRKESWLLVNGSRTVTAMLWRVAVHRIFPPEADLNEAEAADATRGRFERQRGNWDSVGSQGGPCDPFKKNDAR